MGSSESKKRKIGDVRERIPTEALPEFKKAKEESLSTAPIIVIDSNDISKELEEYNPLGAEIIGIEELKISIIFTEEKLIRSLPHDNPSLAADLSEAADFKRIKREIAYAHMCSVEDLLEKLKDEDANETELETEANESLKREVDRIVGEATKRALEVLKHKSKVSVEYRHFKIETGLKLGLKIVGTVAGGAALTAASAVFAGPAMVITMIGTVKAICDIFGEISKLCADVKEQLDEVDIDLKALQKTYTNNKSLIETVEGFQTKKNAGVEIFSAFLKTVLPEGPIDDIVTTIKGTDGKLQLVGNKINGLESKDIRLGKELTTLIETQEKYNESLRTWSEENPYIMEDPEFNKKLDFFFKTKEKINKTATEVDGKCKDLIPKLKKLIKELRDQYVPLKENLDKLKEKKSKYAVAGEILLGTAGSVGFLVAGNVGWPDVGEVTRISGIVGTSFDSAGGATDLIKNIKDFGGEVMKKSKEVH